jgi:hypothetical protein
MTIHNQIKNPQLGKNKQKARILIPICGIKGIIMSKQMY